jgi:hypothetical protein
MHLLPSVRRSWRARLAASTAVLAALVATSLVLNAQRTGSWAYAPRFPESPPDGRFSFARLMYQRLRGERLGSGWTTDYPGADVNFMIRLSELTKAPVSMTPNQAGQPNHVVVSLREDDVFNYPFLLASDVGTIGLNAQEAARMRDYLLKGGFLWVDDFWGPQAWDHWVSQIGRVLPSHEYPITDIPMDHVLLRTLFEVRKIPQIPSISYWRQTGGDTSERGPQSAIVTFRGIFDRRGRLMVLMTHNTDIADGWEREGEDPAFFANFSPDAYALGINAALYALTH